MRHAGRAVIAVILGWLVLNTAAPACPFCGVSGETFLTLTEQSSMVLFGKLKPGTSEKNPNDPAAGTSILEIEKVVKPHESFKDTKLTINRFIDAEMDSKYKFLVFCDIFKGKIDPFRGMAVAADSDLPKYLGGAIAIQKEPTAKKLRFFFDYLDSKDPEVANDAFKEFGNADYKDVREMAQHVSAEKVAGWLTDANTPSYRLGFYGMLLGHCGAKQAKANGELIHKLLEDKDKKVLSGVDGILAGYILLQPKEGWGYLLSLLDNETLPKKPFALRYAALRAARFFWENRTDVIAKKDIIDAVARLLNQDDAVDLAIVDLRKWEAWDQADKVLAVQNTPAYATPIVRRAVIGYALAAAAKVPAAKEYLDAQRKKDAAFVADVEELLRLEVGK